MLCESKPVARKIRAKAKTLERGLVHKSDHALSPWTRGRQIPIGWLALGNEGAAFAQGAAHRLGRDRRIGPRGGHARGGGEIGVGYARGRRRARPPVPPQ